MTTPLNGQIIGQAERATRAVLDRLLTGTGTPFEDWVAINLSATTGPDDLAGRLATGLRVDPAPILARVADAGLLAADGSLTPAGRARYDEIRAGLAVITERLYGDLPPEDLAVAGRVLTTVTARARAELVG
jgi:hypothetical protein